MTPEVAERLGRAPQLAPLHNPPNLVGIRACQKLMPGTPQVAVFDTAFHQRMPRHAYLYAVPYEWYEEYGVRRYGFHGTSHKYVSERAAEWLARECPKPGDAPPDHPPPGQRMQHERRAGTRVAGYQHGFNADRGPGDGDPRWRH